jgi:hypothetical protein
MNTILQLQNVVKLINMGCCTLRAKNKVLLPRLSRLKVNLSLKHEVMRTGKGHRDYIPISLSYISKDFIDLSSEPGYVKPCIGELARRKVLFMDFLPVYEYWKYVEDRI